MEPVAVAALPYGEPSIIELLSLTSFLFVSNIVDFALNRLLFCGLIGQIFVGIAWGTPGGNILPLTIQNAVTDFGYLGLVLIVFEGCTSANPLTTSSCSQSLGGLTTDLFAFRRDLLLSLVVALVGISIPIALSFTLKPLVNASSLTAFAAGASLCSTSLGTTFTVLSASGLGKSRLGMVLTSAAMIDDVIGLVMSGVISSLGASSTFSVTTVIRPVFVSVAFAVFLPMICAWMVKPLTLRYYSAFSKTATRFPTNLLSHEGAALLLYAAILLGLVASSTYARTSNLLAAYLAGVIITWWDNLLNTCRQSLESQEETQQERSQPGKEGDTNAKGTTNDETNKPMPSHQPSRTDTDDHDPPQSGSHSMIRNEQTRFTSGLHIYEKHISPATQYILKPFFFASIGFAIPISQLFAGDIVWRGIIYAILMVIAKLACGLCLVLHACPAMILRSMQAQLSIMARWSGWGWRTCLQRRPPASTAPHSTRSAQTNPTREPVAAPTPAGDDSANARKDPGPSYQAVSLYPAMLLGSAMVARGEIGFLISSIAEADGIFNGGGGGSSSETFLVVTWAILICTVLGPVAVGLLFRRVKQLQMQERGRRSGKADPLGIWGVPLGNSTSSEQGDLRGHPGLSVNPPVVMLE